MKPSSKITNDMVKGSNGECFYHYAVYNRKTGKVTERGLTVDKKMLLLITKYNPQMDIYYGNTQAGSTIDVITGKPVDITTSD